ncbi:hypothetical protein LIER_33563 [Lithospermum erythrorhizon]|uniref:FLZ-type domain-containing protein n=1 Tax=Lithospermum erythrorhizon TaxID=34254 RepID=A0AAV3S0H7_LITER
MVGLSVVLEGSMSSTTSNINSTSSQVLNKTSMMKTSPTSPTPSSPNPFSKRGTSLSTSDWSGFLYHCFLCKEKLLPGKDIYMYKGDRGFCSEECRWRQMHMDEEEGKTRNPKTKKRDNCSLVAINPQLLDSPSSAGSQKGGSKRSNGFAY